jgi:hypothetical protein
MKKAVFLLVIIIFIGSAYFGFKAAAKLGSGITNPQQQNQDLQLTSKQRNYLLVHVTDLGSENPQLIAVWGMFVFYSQSPQLVFVPLYPTYDDAKSNSLNSAYKWEKNGVLSSRFISEIESKFDIVTTGYVAVDNAGLGLFHKWITSEENQISAVTPGTAEEKHIVLYNGQQFFNTACNQFLQSGAAGFLDSIHWSELIPSHFSTNLSFESVALASDIFKTSGAIYQCTVLSDE